MQSIALHKKAPHTAVMIEENDEENFETQIAGIVKLALVKKSCLQNFAFLWDLFNVYGHIFSFLSALFLY